MDWPYKEDTNSAVPPKGFAFLLFEVRICDSKCNKLTLLLFEEQSRGDTRVFHDITCFV